MLKFLGEVRSNCFVNEDAIRAHTGLAAVSELGGDTMRDGFIDVGIIEYDEGGVAAEL